MLAKMDDTAARRDAQTQTFMKDLLEKVLQKNT
jgi:hypothetical protein